MEGIHSAVCYIEKTWQSTCIFIGAHIDAK